MRKNAYFCTIIVFFDQLLRNNLSSKINRGRLESIKGKARETL